MNTEEYNGWTNRETWAVNLHLENDYGLYERVSEMAKNTFNEFEGEPDYLEGVISLEQAIQELVEEVLDFENVNQNYSAFLMLTDIGSLYRVNWREIAEAWLQTAKENEEVSA